MTNDQPTNRGVWLHSYQAPLEMRDLPMPKATSGSAVIEVLATLVLPYMNRLHKGMVTHQNLHLPLVPNATSIGRVHEVGPDAILIKPGDIVWVDSGVYGRDDPSVYIVQGHLGGDGPRGRLLMQGEWRDGSFQKYQKVTLEGCNLLNTSFLCKELGQTIPELTQIILYTVAAGSVFEAAQIKAGDVVVIGPATGSFGGASVELALRCGAIVIVIGRGENTMIELENKLGNPEQLQHAVMTGDVDADTQAILQKTPGGKGADVFIDWTPGWFESPLYMEAGIKALKMFGRVAMSGAPKGFASVHYPTVLHKNINISARWTCTRETIVRILQLINTGLLRIGKSAGAEITTFPLDQHQEAKEYAEKHSRFKSYVVLLPNGENALV